MAVRPLANTLAADYVMFDEAQDANPVTAAIIQSQQNVQQIVVGDRFSFGNAFPIARVPSRSNPVPSFTLSQSAGRGSG